MQRPRPPRRRSACNRLAGGSSGATTVAPHPTSSAAAAADNQPASPVPPGPGPFASDATDRKLATSLAAGIQRAFTPPPGSRELSGPPAGTWRDLGVPGGVISTDGEVLVSSWWKVPGQPQAVLKWLLAHAPRPWSGGDRGSFGPVGEPGDGTPAGQRPADVYQERNDSFDDFRGCRQASFSVPGTSALPLLAEVNDRLVPAILSVAGLSWFS